MDAGPGEFMSPVYHSPDSRSQEAMSRTLGRWALEHQGPGPLLEPWSGVPGLKSMHFSFIFHRWQY